MKKYLELLKPLRSAMADFSPQQVQVALAKLLAPDCLIHMVHPFGDIQGSKAFYDLVYQDLYHAIPDLERRDFITIQGLTSPSGSDQNNNTNGAAGDDWVGCAGHYVGTFMSPWLGIPATGHFVHMRLHEFYRFQGDQVVEMQALWDIPELMMQANAWPMTPALGRDNISFGPATNDGLQVPTDETLAIANKALIVDMLTYMVKYPSQGGPEVMQMERFWHPRCTWYGPAGVGTCRGINGFRRWHQEPFLKAMPDRGHDSQGLDMHFFADGNYVAVTGWPNMKQTLSHDGWLGIVPTGQVITLRSLDFWRIENGLIKENWVLFDLLHIYHQLGVDVLGRMAEMNNLASA